jgi:hypothetical protein
MTIVLSLLVCLLGLLFYGFSGNPKVSEVGRMMFWTGLLSFLLLIGGRHVVDLTKF